MFHYLRRLGKFFFNSIISFVILFYFFTLMVFSLIKFFYFLFYIPFKFLYVQNLFTFLVLNFKLLFVFIYLVPVFLLLVFLLLIYFFIKFFYSKVKLFYNQKYIHLFALIQFRQNLVFSRIYFTLLYLVFKLRSSSYVIFSSLKKFISLNNLITLGFKLNSSFFNLLNTDSFYGNLLYYNSSFIFKRVRPYLLRFNNTQFLHYFLYIQNTSRITPDQFKAFCKIGLNGQYPVYYFERLFDIEYSRLELEYELPYYWSFMRQAHSFNQGFLHPKFHVFGLLNYLKFY